MALKALLFISLLTLTSLFSDTSIQDAEFRGEAKAKIIFLENKNAELKTKFESLEDKQKSVEEYKAIIDRQDKRIEDVNAKMASVSEKTSWLAIIVGLWAIVATFISIGIPLYLTFRWKKEVTEEAKESAKNQINALEQEFEKTVQKAKEELEKINKTHSEYIQQKDLMKNQDIIEYTKSEPDATGLKGALEYALYQAQINNNYDKWFDVAMFSLKLKDKKSLEYWDNAINLAPNDISKVIALVNKGVTLGQLNESAKAIEVYEELDRRFKDNKNDAIQEYVAKALGNKGFRLGQLNESAKAIEVYEELDRRFKDNKNDAIQEQVAKVLFNLFELQLIENQEWNMDMVNWCLEYEKSNKQVHLEFAMLKIIKEALTVDQTSTIKTLKQALKDTNYGSWSWKELDTWAEKIEDKEAKKRVQQTIEAFKNWNKKE